ncbi:cell wall-binding repeat-containing protein [Kineococcus auxinigenes]|uniref:cell wall-binding repeat-containing protein n=1 Tax=unclassified Kineococcus TaxID=2621656 RepID=UPI003D7E783F
MIPVRLKLAAALAATTLAGAALATAGSAAAQGDTPVKTATSSAWTGSGVQLKSATTERGNLRLSGRDRYETAAEVSAAIWEYDNTPIVFLASGTSFPDALAAGPSSLGAGPLLLTERDSLPAATRAELQRLRPCYLVVVGGASSVSDAVFADAEQYTDPAGCPA